jgi:hypothetical protein
MINILKLLVAETQITASSGRNQEDYNVHNINKSKDEVAVVLENKMPISGMKNKIFITCDAETTIEHLQMFVKKSNNIDGEQGEQASGRRLNTIYLLLLTE